MHFKTSARGILAATLLFAGAAFLNGQTVIKSDWPKDKIPADVAVFTFAGVTDHGPSSDGYWIKVADGKAADMAKYVALMTGKGWKYEKRGSFEYLKKGDETVELRLFSDENIAMLIVTVFVPPREWPIKAFPELPEPRIGAYSFNTDPDSGTTITISRITQAELVDYFKLLVSKGWKGVPDELELKRTTPRKLNLIAGENGENEWSLFLSTE